MPLPSRRKYERERPFMARCMRGMWTNERERWTADGQKAAICYSQFRRNPPLDLGLAEVTEQGIRFSTGEPVTFRFLRGTRPAPNLGSKYQQDIEPAGRYMVHNETPGDLAHGWETGIVSFQRPLVLWLTTDPDRIYGPGSWKARLAAAYQATGADLTRALLADGYDSIVTVGRYQDHRGHRPPVLDTREIVDLRVPLRNPPLGAWAQARKAYSLAKKRMLALFKQRRNRLRPLSKDPTAPLKHYCVEVSGLMLGYAILAGHSAKVASAWVSDSPDEDNHHYHDVVVFTDGQDVAWADPTCCRDLENVEELEDYEIDWVAEWLALQKVEDLMPSFMRMQLKAMRRMP